MSRRVAASVLGILVCATVAIRAGPVRDPYPWVHGEEGQGLAARIQPPAGFKRVMAADGSFASWLRGLPLGPGRPPVHLFDGRLKRNQEAHHAVVLMDPGTTDLEQCADAVIRLRAEFQFARGCDESITFHLTNGSLASWERWRQGERPAVKGARVTWSRSAAVDASYASFRRYLDVVFTYAGSASLATELETVMDPSAVEPGDVFIRGGFPGHAVLVVDVAAGPGGERAFLIAQSYMPAQEVHVLRNPDAAWSPWYPAARSGPLKTPEWEFDYAELRRFPRSRCTERPRDR